MRRLLVPLAAVVLIALSAVWSAAETSAEPSNASGSAIAGGAPWLAPSALARYHLVPAPRIVLSTCAMMAAQARSQDIRMTVFCPPVVPGVVPIRRELAGGILRYHSYSDGYNASFWSPSARWAYDWGGHWTFAAGATQSLKLYVEPPGAAIHAVTTRRLTLAGVRVTLYSMSPTAPAFYAGHLVMAWRQAAKTFNLSVHGARWEARLAGMTTALIREVRDCSRSAQRPPACQAFVFPAKP